MPSTKKHDLKSEVKVTSTNSESPKVTENEEAALETSLEIDTGSEGNNESRNKRSASSSNKENTPAKKLRSKPQPKIIENMKEYFDNDTLEQLTTTTLRHWLKEKQLHCTTRERKNNLIEKVRKHFLEGTSL